MPNTPINKKILWGGIFLSLVVVGAIITAIVLTMRNRTPGKPGVSTDIAGEGSSNPGVFIGFTSPSTYGNKATYLKAYKFYLSKTKNIQDNKLVNSYILTNKISNNINSVENAISWRNTADKTQIFDGELDTLNKINSDLIIKFDKSQILDLEHEGEYFVGVSAMNDLNLYGDIVWSDSGIIYNKCRDDPNECWAGGADPVGDSSGDFSYVEPDPTMLKERCFPSLGSEPGKVYRLNEKNQCIESSTECLPPEETVIEPGSIFILNDQSECVRDDTQCINGYNLENNTCVPITPLVQRPDSGMVTNNDDF